MKGHHLERDAFFKLLEKVKLVAFDFDGVFTDNAVWVSEAGHELVRCNRSDGLGLRKLKNLGLDLIIISSEKNSVVAERAKKLEIECFHGVEDKEAALTEECLKRNIKLEEALFLGNDINDLSVMRIVGVPVAVADAYEEIHSSVVFLTNKSGGQGAVRELCDLIVQARKDSHA